MPFDGHRTLRSWAASPHRPAIEPELLEWITDIADAMIPAEDGWPSASDADISAFVAAHIDEGALAGFRQARSLVAADTDAAAALQTLAASELIGLFLVYVYTGYYAAPAVVKTIQARGSDYHGPPQPDGYVIPEPAPVPLTPRGSYIPTAEVTRVA